MQIVSSDRGLPMTISVPDVKTFCGLDEAYMTMMYNRMRYAFQIGKGWVYKKQPISLYDLIIVGYLHKSDKQNFKERQALLALEQLGKIKRLGFVDWFLDEIWVTCDYKPEDAGKVVEAQDKDYNG